jgi:hypothetical protein
MGSGSDHAMGSDLHALRSRVSAVEDRLEVALAVEVQAEELRRDVDLIKTKVPLPLSSSSLLPPRSPLAHPPPEATVAQLAITQALGRVCCLCLAVGSSFTGADEGGPVQLYQCTRGYPAAYGCRLVPFVRPEKCIWRAALTRGTVGPQDLDDRNLAWQKQFQLLERRLLGAHSLHPHICRQLV